MAQPKLLVPGEAAAKEAEAQDVSTASNEEAVKAARRQVKSHAWPVWTAVAVSLVWLILGAAYAGVVLKWQVVTLPPYQLASLVAGLFMPIAAFWFIALYVRRSEDLKQAARALERSLVPLGFPGEASERRIESVTRRLAVHASELSAAIEMAQKEAERIEQLFAQQTFRLAETTDEAGRKAVIVRELLAENHSEIDSRISALEAKARELDAMLETRMQMISHSGEALADQLRNVDHTLETSAQNLAAAGSFAGQRAETYTKLMDESISQFRTAIAEVEGTADRVSETLESERHALATTSQRMQSDGAALRNTLKDEQAALERTAESLATSSEAARNALKSEIALLAGASNEWNDRLEAATNTASAHLRALEEKAAESITGVADAAARARDLLKEGGSAFDEEGQRIIEVTEGAAESMKEQVAGLRSLAEEAEQRWLLALDQTVKAAHTATENVSASAADMVASSDLAADKLTGRMDRLKESWSQRLWQLETATTQSIQEAKNSSEALAQTAEHIGGRILELLDKLREAGTFAEDERARIGTSVEQIAEDVSAATGKLAAAHETLGQQIDSTFDGTTRLEDLLKSMSGSFAELLDEVASRTGDIEERITVHGQQLSDASKQASDMIREAGEGLENVTSRMTGSGSELLTNIERLSKEAAQVEEKLSAAGEISDRAVTRLQSALTDAMQRLEEVGLSLGSKAELVERLSGQSGDALEKAGETLASRAGDIQAQVERAASALQTAGDMFNTAVGDGETRAVAASSSITEAVTGLNDTAERLADSVADIKERLEAVAGGFEGAQDNTLERFREAVTTLTNAEAQLREHAFDMVGMAERSASQLRETSGSIIDRAQALIDASAQAESAVVSAGDRLSKEAASLQFVMARLISDHEKFSQNVGVAADAAFMHEAGLITESLQSIAIDIDRALEADLPDSAWENYLKGDKSLFARRVLKMGTRDVRGKIAERFETDAEFQEHATRYCKRFETLLRRAKDADRDGTLSVALISSHMGRLYVLLGQSIKRLHS